MPKLNIEKVATLPVPLSPATFYIVKNADGIHVDLYFTENGTPTALHSITSDEVDAKITAAMESMPSGGSKPKSYAATAGQTDFTYTDTLTTDSMVFLNGSLQTIDDTYTIAGAVATFLEPRVVLDKVVIMG